MNKYEQKGRNLVLLVIGIFIGTSLITALLTMLSLGFRLNLVLILGFYTLLSSALFMGYGWAHWLVGILTLTNGIADIWGGIMSTESVLWFRGILILLGLALLASCFILFKMDDIPEFLRYQRSKTAQSQDTPLN